MKKYNGTNPPILEPHQFSITQAEAATGIVLNLSGLRRDRRERADWMLIFESFAEARKYAEERTAQRPEIECWINNYKNQAVRRISICGISEY